MTISRTAVPGRLPPVALGAALAFALTLFPVGAAAQVPDDVTPRWSVGWAGSWFGYSPFLEADPGRLNEDLVFEDGIGGQVFVERWLNRWVSIHADGSYDKADLTAPGQVRSVSVWTANVGLQLKPLNGLLHPVEPYLFGTGGLISYGIGGADLLLPGREVMFSSDDTEQFMAQAGGGVDILFLSTYEWSRIGVRLEAARMIPLERPFVFVGEENPGSHGFWRFSVGLVAQVMPD